MRPPRVRLRSLMVAVVVFALVLAVVVRSVRLRQSLAREQMLRAERDEAEARARAVSDSLRADLSGAGPASRGVAGRAQGGR